MLEENTKAAIYCRVALADTLALEAQRISLSQFAKAHGFDDCAEYLDNGVSGLTMDRPAFARLDEDIRAGRIQAVFIRKVSRISRDCFTLHRWLRDTQSLGVTVISQCDGVLSTAGGLVDALARAHRQMAGAS